MYEYFIAGSGSVEVTIATQAKRAMKPLYTSCVLNFVSSVAKCVSLDFNKMYIGVFAKLHT